MIQAAAIPKVQKLVRLLGTDSDGEAVAAVRALGRTLEAHGCSFHDLAAAVAPTPDYGDEPSVRRPPRSRADEDHEMWSDLILRCQSHTSRLSPRDRTFLADMADVLRAGRMPSLKQRAWLGDIATKVQRWEFTP